MTKRLAMLLLPALLLIGLHGLLRAQSADPDPGAAEAPAYASRLPEKYRPIIERGMFGFLPRENPTAEESSPPVVSGQPQSLPDTLVEFQHDPGLTLGGPAAQGPRFSLTGILQVNNAYKAIIVDNTGGQGYYVAQGDTVGGYTVQKITDGRVVLSNHAGQLVLTIDTPRQPSTLVPDIQQPGKKEPAPPPEIERLPPHVQPRIGR